MEQGIKTKLYLSPTESGFSRKVQRNNEILVKIPLLSLSILENGQPIAIYRTDLNRSLNNKSYHAPNFDSGGC